MSKTKEAMEIENTRVRSQFELESLMELDPNYKSKAYWLRLHQKSIEQGFTPATEPLPNYLK